MAKLITKDKSLEVRLFDNKIIEIESKRFKNVSIEIKVPDPTDPLTPVNALYRILIYQSKEKVKNMPFEYGTAWVMTDGTILKGGKEYSEYMRKHEG